tara:strand:+ start:165 stop:1052 length:888 start_codon:yes stop_codon:yes gene_type:complete
MEKYALFHIEGGLGKHVAATAVARCIKNNHPDRQLIVVCGYPEVYLNLKFIDKVYRIGTTPYFYDSYIKDKDMIIFKHEPYFTTDHIVKRKPLIQNWCNLYNLEYNGETPELSFNLRQKQIGLNKWQREKPVMLIQTNGGPLGDEQPFFYSWTRDLPYKNTLDIADYFKENYHIIQICRKDENIIPDVEVIKEPLSNMELFSLLLISQKRLFIDSCMQHASCALNLPSTVCWVGTSPSIFGYELHDNITADIPKGLKMHDSYLFDYSFQGEIHECPFTDEEIFDSNQLINSLNNQ